MSKSGKEIVAEAAGRAAELIDDGSTTRTKPILIANQFAPVAELIEAARERVDKCSNCGGMPAPCSRCTRTVAALAKVEKR